MEITNKDKIRKLKHIIRFYKNQPMDDSIFLSDSIKTLRGIFRYENSDQDPEQALLYAINLYSYLDLDIKKLKLQIKKLILGYGKLVKKQLKKEK